MSTILAVLDMFNKKLIKNLFLFFLASLSIVNASNIVVSQTDEQAQKDKQVFMRGLIEGKVPQASARGSFSWKTGVFSTCPNQCNHLNDLAIMLSNALREAGYSEQGWYLVEEGVRYSVKIAVITQLEQILDNGQPQKDGKRWNIAPSAPSVSSWSNFISTLLKGAEPGRYRSFLFGFSEEPMLNSAIGWQRQSRNSEENFRALNNAIRNGARLPVFKSLEKIKTKTMDCYVFVYEYTVSPVDGSVKFVERSHLTGEEHLKAAGIWKALGGK